MNCLSLCSDLEKHIPLDGLFSIATSSREPQEPLGAQTRRIICCPLWSTSVPRTQGHVWRKHLQESCVYTCALMHAQFSTTLSSLPLPSQGQLFLPELAITITSLEVSQLFVHAILPPELCFDFVAITHKWRILQTLKIYLWHCAGSLLIGKPFWLTVISAWKVSKRVWVLLVINISSQGHEMMAHLIMILNKMAVLLHLSVLRQGLAVRPRMTQNLQSSCLRLPSTGIKGGITLLY